MTSRALVHSVTLAEHSIVRALREYREAGVHAGESGTIAHVYGDGAYEVEFLEGRARPAVVTVENADVEAVAQN